MKYIRNIFNENSTIYYNVKYDRVATPPHMFTALLHYRCQFKFARVAFISQRLII